MKKVIFDTDMGIDDMVSVLLALSTPHVEIVAFTIVEGNVDIIQGLENAKLFCSLSGYHIPIFAGSKPLIQGIFHPNRWPGHGMDGFGDATLEPEFQTLLKQHNSIDYKNISIETKHAAIALIDFVTKYPNELDLIVLGPLTNLGLAISLDPTFLTKCKSCTIMGGCLYAKGNVNNTAEFNIHYDPEAAHIVFESSRNLSKVDNPLITLVTWEVTVDNAYGWDLIDSLSQTKYGELIRLATKKAKSMIEPSQYIQTEFDEHNEKCKQCVLPDATAMMVYLFPEIIKTSKNWSVDVELYGLQTRGMTHLQWMGDFQTNCHVLLSLDGDLMRLHFKNTFLQSYYSFLYILT